MTGQERSRRDAEFRSPGAEHRSLPFWAWNAVLEEEELVHQIRSLARAGAGGFFMHSRDGLETPYLGEAWRSAVRAAVETAEEEGLPAWLYDEDRWPSGAAGGRVPARGDEYRAKALTLELLEGDYLPTTGAVVLFRARVEGLRYAEGERLDPTLPWAAGEGRSFLVFRIEVSAGDQWFNGESPPDNLNPATVDAFLDLNYRPYLELLGDRFGSSVPGIFTDEPSVHDRHSRYTPGRGWIPWTYAFADFFVSRRGYDPLDSIPLVFFDGAGQERIRHDYWRSVTELFSETYSGRIAAWCAAHGLGFTGHFLWENQLGTATRTGGAVMPHYRFQDIPGIDLLCEQIEETLTVKQCTSVANQYGRPRVLSEMYGGVGWEFTFEGQKWLGDWQYVQGVNLRCQHLALYSLKGCRKRDYPPVFNYNSSWWAHNRIVEDYFARLSVALSPGAPVRDLLVLHPSSTAWCRLASNPRGFADRGSDRNLPELNAYGDEFNRFLRALLGAHHDFDLGDETILAENGRVVPRRAGLPRSGLFGVGDAEGPSLVVNRASYRLVLIPRIDSMFRSTLTLLLDFLSSGGRVVAVGPRATLVEGGPSAELDALYGHPNTTLLQDSEGALGVVEALLPRRVSLRGRYLVEDPALLCSLRGEGEGATLFAVNTDRGAGREILIEVEGVASVEELDPLTGEIRGVPAGAAGGRTRFRADFGPAGSRLYRLDFSSAPTGEAEAASFSPSPNFLVNPPILGALGPSAAFSRSSPNALVLDRCSYQLSRRPRSPEMEVWRAQSEVREALGMRQIYYNGLAQRYTWVEEAHRGDGAPLSLFFRFRVSKTPETPVHLVLEDPQEYRLSLDGEALGTHEEGWFLDRSFRKLRLPPLGVGDHELVLSCSYRNRMEVEDCFLLGDFAVDSDGRIAEEPRELRFGDWCLQGYPHYCGSIVYRFGYELAPGQGGPIRLYLGEFSAVVVVVRVNGREAGFVPWRSADGVDLSGTLREGRNEIEIEVVASPRNLLGPFHLARGRVSFHEWSAFRPQGIEYTPGYVLHPYGLFAQVVLRAD